MFPFPDATTMPMPKRHDKTRRGRKVNFVISTGVASFKYTGAKAGTGQLQASATVTNGPEISNVVQLT